MAIEIERKFLLRDARWRTQIVRSRRFVQGYLVGAAAPAPGAARASVRVRVAEADAWLNIKSARTTIEREEFEYPIPRADAERMLARLCGPIVEKIRHDVPVDGFVFEVDEFLGANAGLVVAEIELPAADAVFPQPAWLGREVSRDARYLNVQLAEYPYSTWDLAQRQEEI